MLEIGSIEDVKLLEKKLCLIVGVIIKFILDLLDDYKRDPIDICIDLTIIKFDD